MQQKSGYPWILHFFLIAIHTEYSKMQVDKGEPLRNLGNKKIEREGFLLWVSVGSFECHRKIHEYFIQGRWQ